MANSAADIQKLYIAYFNRPADPLGLAYWEAQNQSMSSIAENFALQTEYASVNAGLTTAQIINGIYVNLFGHAADAPGLTYWAGQVNNGAVSMGVAALAILNGATGADLTAVNAKTTAATSFTTAVDTTAEIVGYAGASANAEAKAWLSPVVDATTLAAAQATQDATIADLTNNGGATYTLTNGTDVATAAIFNSGLVYTPDGGSRINALQNEDQLTGTGTNATLNATVGQGQDNGSTTVQPVLKNIAVIHTQFTGNNGVGLQTAPVTTFDLRAADAALKTLTIDRIGALNNVTYDNISTAGANNLGVSNNAADYTTAQFLYQNGQLVAAAQTGTLTIDNVNMAKGGITIQDHAGNGEGFETLNLISNNGANALGTLSDAQLENLVITGNSSSLSLVSTQNLLKGGVTEGVQFNAGNGIANPNSVGLRTIDASGFAGNLSLDITNAVGGHNDPSNSGQQFFTKVTGGAGNDTFWTGADLAANGKGKDVLVGGAGKNTLKLYDANIVLHNAAGVVNDTANNGDVGFIADVSGIQTLELRSQTNHNVTVNMKAFSDNAVTDVLVRNEAGAGALTFTLENVSAALASSGKVVLHHGVDATATDVVKMQLADATGTSDTVALTVVNDLNTTTTYNYALNTTAMLTSLTDLTAHGKVENVTIHDNDTESNVVTLVNAADHTGTVTLDGGVAGQTYKVNYADGSAPILAATLDASAQLSNLFLQVAPAAATVQTVKLGTGSDALLFANAARDAGSLDLLKGTEVITDAGGADVVTAVFSADVTGKPSFTGIETFQTAATANVAMDLSSTGLTTLNLLSDAAVDGTVGSSDLYNLAAGSILTTSIITANGTAAVSTLNFAGSNDDGLLGNVGSNAQVFNGVTLNTTAPTLTVNINSKAVGLDNATHAEAGAASYALGQLTSQGTTTMNIVVADELAIVAGATSSATATVVDNIWAKNLATLTVSANGDVDLGTITGNALNNNQTLVDATAVKGLFTATDIALGDAAQVKLGNGGVHFDALGSAGKAVTITAGNGVDWVQGTAQNDTITTGSAADTILGDRGDNVITSGAGNDSVNVKDGNNTMNIGSGTLESVSVNVGTGLNASLATNVVTGNGTVAEIAIAKLGAAATFDQEFAVGAGHDLGLHFLGDTIQLASSTLDGRVAQDADTAVVSLTNVGHLISAVNANSYLLVGAVDITEGAAATVNLTKATAGVFLDYTIGGTADTGANGLTVIGSKGNDAIVLTNAGANTVTAGAGADYVVLSNTAAVVDKIIVGDGQSTLAGFDQVYNFLTTGLLGAGNDTLALQSTNVAADVGPGAVTGVTTGIAATPVTYAITNGLVTLGGGMLIGATADATHISLAQAVAFLTAKTVGLDAATFAYDANNNGLVDAADGTFVFQNTAQGTLVELVGVNGVTAIGAAAANVIHLV